MSACRCCDNKNAGVMAPLCDRCFLGWNNCCEFRIVLDEISATASKDICEELGFFEVPFSLQIKRMNRRIQAAQKIKEVEED